MPGMAPAGRALLAWACAATIALFALACARAAETPGDGVRIVSVGGAVTETIYALGAGARVVAVDTSSVYPEAATKLTQIGYQRSLSAEPILALRPTVVIAAPEAGPPAALEQLRAAGVRVEIMPQAHSPDAAAARVVAVARALGGAPGSEELAAALARDAQAAAGRARARSIGRRVVFVYARGGGNVMVAGKDTAADAMIALSGGQNAFDGFEGFKALSPEAMAAAAPDVLLVLSRGLDSLGGVDGVLALPGVAGTPAGRSRSVVAMDDLLLLGFGPRLTEAIDELSRWLSGAAS